MSLLPLVFPVLNVPAIQALVGSSPARIYRHGSAPQGAAVPYITWFEVAGQPYDQISGAPDSDFDTVQIDCWAGNGDPTTNDGDVQVETLALAVRNALDAAGFSNRMVVNQRDPDTKRFHIGIEADFITSR
jgi:hypothetical protein